MKLALLISISIILLLPADLHSAQGTDASRGIPLSHPVTLSWLYSSERLAVQQPACDQNTVYIPASNGMLITLRALDGQLAWKAEAGGNFSAPLVVNGEIIYLTTEATKLEEADHFRAEPPTVRAVSRVSGVTLWSRKLPKAVRGDLVTGDQSLFITLEDSELLALEKETGKVRWSLRLPHPLDSGAEPFGSKLLLSTRDGYIFAIDQQAGRILWRYRTRQGAGATFGVGGDIIYYNTPDGYIGALREIGGEPSCIWQKRLRTRIQTLSPAEHGLLVTTQDNFALFYATPRGKRLWKRLLPAKSAAPTLDGNGNALLAPLGEEACIVLSLRDGKQVNAITLGRDNEVIAAPIVCGEMLFVPTRNGLMAFAPAK